MGLFAVVDGIPIGGEGHWKNHVAVESKLSNTAAVVNGTRCKKRKESAMFESLEEKAYNVKFMNDPMVGGGNTSLEPLKELYPKFYCLKLYHP